jgi:hypothetical protein
MLRAAGRFKRSSYPLSTVTVQDEGQVLEEKWKQWAASESHKRYVMIPWFLDGNPYPFTDISKTMLSSVSSGRPNFNDLVVFSNHVLC